MNAPEPSGLPFECSIEYVFRCSLPNECSHDQDRCLVLGHEVHEPKSCFTFGFLKNVREQGGGDKRRAGASRGGIPRLRVTDWSSKRSGAVHIQHGTELSW